MPLSITPGPLYAKSDAVPEYVTQITVYAEADGKRVATVYTSQADADAIAALPELLEAATAAQRAFYVDGTRKALLPAMQNLTAALRKAGAL